MLLCIFGLFLAASIHYLDFSQLIGRFDQLASKQGDPSVTFRIEARKAASHMLSDNWMRGVGAGGFRYLFVNYVSQYPEIYQGGSLFWEHAHCDWIEIPIEIGLVGDLIIATAFVYYFRFIRRLRWWTSAAAMPLSLACLLTLLHAWVDFPYQCPAILVTWCFLATAAAKWLLLRNADIRSLTTPKR